MQMIHILLKYIIWCNTVLSDVDAQRDFLYIIRRANFLFIYAACYKWCNTKYDSFSGYLFSKIFTWNPVVYFQSWGYIGYHPKES